MQECGRIREAHGERTLVSLTNLPGHTGRHVKLFEQEAVADRRVVDHVGEGGVGLIVHAEAAVDELELAARHELLDKGLGLGVGLVVPALEEGLLDVCERRKGWRVGGGWGAGRTGDVLLCESLLEDRGTRRRRRRRSLPRLQRRRVGVGVGAPGVVLD